jgi:hypothetical protein
MRLRCGPIEVALQFRIKNYIFHGLNIEPGQQFGSKPPGSAVSKLN